MTVAQSELKLMRIYFFLPHLVIKGVVICLSFGRVCLVSILVLCHYLTRRLCKDYHQQQDHTLTAAGLCRFYCLNLLINYDHHCNTLLEDCTCMLLSSMSLLSVISSLKLQNGRYTTKNEKAVLCLQDQSYLFSFCAIVGSSSAARNL